jgi:hypothetical protein
MPVRGAAPLQRTERNNSDNFAHAPLRRVDPHPRDTFDGEGFATIHRPRELRRAGEARAAIAYGDVTAIVAFVWKQMGPHSSPFGATLS